MATLAVRYDFAAVLGDDERRCRSVAEILTRPCFRELERVSAHRGDRWINHAKTSADAIVEILRDRTNSGASFDTKRSRELVAGGEIKNGTYETNKGAVRFNSHLVFPLVVDEIETTVASLCELAGALDTGAGFVAAEPSYPLAQDAALGGALPKSRIGLSDQRRRERRGRDWHQWQRHDELAGPEWGTFLGAEHLARIDLASIGASGTFERVILVSPRLAFLQLTKNPADDLSEDFEPKLQRARRALAPIMMDLGDVNLE